MFFRFTVSVATLSILLHTSLAAQNPQTDPPSAENERSGLSVATADGLDTIGGKWGHFVRETASPFTIGAGVFNASFSQVTNTDPKYGQNGSAYAERFGASVADITTQNFFGDFVIASATREDPRYFREGPSKSLLHRIGYALS
jgi:hypothetical protein